MSFRAQDGTKITRHGSKRTMTAQRRGDRPGRQHASRDRNITQHSTGQERSEEGDKGNSQDETKQDHCPHVMCPVLCAGLSLVLTVTCSLCPVIHHSPLSPVFCPLCTVPCPFACPLSSVLSCPLSSVLCPLSLSPGLAVGLSLLRCHVRPRPDMSCPVLSLCHLSV